MASPQSEELLLGGKNPRHDSLRSSRRLLYVTCASLGAASLFALVLFALWTSQTRHQSNPSVTLEPSYLNKSAPVDLLGPETHLVGLPTSQFRDNLRPDAKYITSWPSAGWTNDVMTYANLIYLGLITDRIPIMPMFTPSHLGSVPPISFGEVFDLPRLRKSLGKPILEWHDVKDQDSESIDEIGCWNTWEAVQEREHYPRRSDVPRLLKLDISYTKAPGWIKVLPHYDHDLHSYFWALAALAFPETRETNLVAPSESPEHHVSLPPDEQVLCYDYLYYVCANQPFEFEFDYSPAWRFVGRHMRWVPKLERLADEYIRRAIGAEEGTPTPPWIAIHMRHADFANWCNDMLLSDCFASMPVIARRVQEVRDDLLKRKGLVVDHVIMTSDEKNATWWDDVVAQGWFGVDHSKTVELYGPWYPVLIDAVIQSSGVGFVGTDRSTMSMIARRRTQAWQNGVVRTVKWGKPGADDH